MRILISEHARERITQRNIPELQIYTTIKKPQSSTKSYRNRIILKRTFKTKILEVVTKVEKSCIIVISAYYHED